MVVGKAGVGILRRGSHTETGCSGPRGWRRRAVVGWASPNAVRDVLYEDQGDPGGAMPNGLKGPKPLADLRFAGRSGRNTLGTAIPREPWGRRQAPALARQLRLFRIKRRQRHSR